MVSITAETILDAPCPRVGVTVEGLSAGEQVISVWRTADGERSAVRGARAVDVVESFYVEDFEAPLARDVTYDLEVVSGVDAGGPGVSVTTNVPSVHGYIQDPLDPSTAVRVLPRGGRDGSAVLVSGSFASMTYEAPVSAFNVVGSSMPVSIGGTRARASGTPLSLLVTAEDENRRMRALVMSASNLLIRGTPSWGSRIPGSATYSTPSFTEKNPVPGDTATVWETSGDIVRPSSARLVVSLFTYQDVAALFATYDDKQSAVAGGTYLADQKMPSGSDVQRPVAGSGVDGGGPGTTVFDSTLDGGI